MVDERLIYHLRPIFNIFLQNPALSKQKGKKCLNLPHSPLHCLTLYCIQNNFWTIFHTLRELGSAPYPFRAGPCSILNLPLPDWTASKRPYTGRPDYSVCRGPSRVAWAAWKLS